MNEYTLQSYFKSLCKSFSIAYHQLKRLEEQEDKLQEASPYEEIEVVESLLKFLELDIPEELKNKYVEKKVSEEVLRRRQKELKEAAILYKKEKQTLEEQRKFWAEHMWKIQEEAQNLISAIHKRGFSIIVTEKEEILVFMSVFRKKVKDVINTEEEYLKIFPKGEKCEEFLRVYLTKEKEKIKAVCEKYF